MSNYDIHYHVCKNPINNSELEYYNVRKFIIDKDRGIIETCENYQYSKRNINKLIKDIKYQNYKNIDIEKNDFENVPYPSIKS